MKLWISVFALCCGHLHLDCLLVTFFSFNFDFDGAAAAGTFAHSSLRHVNFGGTISMRGHDVERFRRDVDEKVPDGVIIAAT